MTDNLADEQVSAPPARGERLRKVLSRANPIAPGALEPSHTAPDLDEPAGHSLQDVVVRPAAELDLPTWIQPFTMPSNARFTRTPDYLLRERALAGKPSSAEHPAHQAHPRAGIAPTSVPRARAITAPPRPGIGVEDDVTSVRTRSATEPGRRRVPTQEPAPSHMPVVSETPNAADILPPPATIRTLNRVIRVGTDEPSTSPDQDNDPWNPAAAPTASAAAGPHSGELPALAFPVVRILEARFTWQPLASEPNPAPMRAAPVVASAVPKPGHVAPSPVRVAVVEAPPMKATPSLVARIREPASFGEYVPPPLSLLAEPAVNEPAYEASAEFLDKSSVTLQQTLHDFGVRGEIIDANPGPVVTLYELEPAPGTKSSRVTSLSNDIARSMSAVSARVAVVPGRNVIGIELPNVTRETVYLRELLETSEFSQSKHRLAVCLGKNIGGEPIIADLARMPHLLVAGTTGSGKSVAINTMILSLLYAHSPEQCRLIMVDPKMLELSVYEGIPHLLSPVVTDPKKAVIALRWAVREMEERYKKMSALGVRNIDGFNERVGELALRGETVTRPMQTGFNRTSGDPLYEDEVMDLKPLPYIVVIVDEMADLMMVAGKDIEGAIQRLAQMARAAGIHLIMATQRPSVDVITGTIKANFPTRISFQVTSKIDSRTILGEMGAEQLLGQGDMLYMMGGGRITRVHGPFVSDAEVEKVVAHLKTQGRPEYLDAVTADADEPPAVATGAADVESAVFDKGAMAASFGDDSQDPYDQAIAVVMRDRKASTSYIQRRLGIGYNRAASIMERMETEGIVGPANHAGKREILGAGHEAQGEM